jgi:nicotinate-nucleotide pyrophosphorylase (carboxylating)
LLDKRAIHLGGGGTHRIGLGDAILVKNNHLALLAEREEEAAPVAIGRAWKHRDAAAFIEVEVRSAAGARIAAQTFQDLQAADGAYSCLLLLDNMPAHQITETIADLRKAELWDGVLIEASGSITEENIGQYAASGVDAISVGALTHSVRALDISQRII